MKIELSTPPENLKKIAKWCGIAGWFLLLYGFGGVASGSVVGLFIMCFAVWLLRQRKKARKTLTQQAAAETEIMLQRSTYGNRDFVAEYHAQCQAAREALEEFLEKNELVRTIRTKVVGVTHQNSDGSSRQKHLAECIDGASVELRYFTYKGAPAYSVHCCGDQIGNLPADLARDLYELPDTYTLVGEIDEVTGGEDGLKYGCNLRIDIYREK